ncbi:hypothetical protein HNE_2745 [Hyphomonas neptunium ATCC 15444]|uniref:Apple domain-containing protein n=2 Tax=Hyphomonas TaxID=85 RepID=Q0BYL9_HYPNA|nr:MULTISPECIES: PAN domain-containing protein [Hyphomonas]ABI77603.1 hypothetical protein HNE_2745 [Hyphomonas neptunium ATCC 15444]KCZ91550.1 hypothetical protein HHI_13199 [Hyphomonas hirschiana VP5]
MLLLRVVLVSLLALLSLAAPALAEGPPYPGQVVHGFDYGSERVSRGDWKACQELCNGNGACRVWSIMSNEGKRDSVCYLKHSEGKFEPWATIDSGLRTAPLVKAGGAPDQGHGFSENDITSVGVDRDDWKTCEAACNLNGACKAWSLYSPPNHEQSYCWIKDAVGERKPLIYTDSGLKTQQTPIPDPGKQVKGKAFSGAVVIDRSLKAEDVQACKASCEGNRQCVAWTLFNPEKKSYPARCHGYAWAGEQVKFKRAVSAWREAPVLAEVAPPTGDEMLRWRSLEEVVAEFAPKITPRALTVAEKAEIAGLELAYLQGGSFDYFRKLDALARTGDKAAMKAMINILLETGFGYNRDWPADFPYKVRATQSFGERTPGATPLQRTTALALAMPWAVQYWQLHGGDPKAAMALTQCANSNQGRHYQYDCGFTLSYNGKSNAQALSQYAFGDTKTPPDIVLATHEPASSVEMEQYRFTVERARYETLVNTRRSGQKLLDLDANWLNKYAEAMGLTDSMNASIAQGEAIRMQMAAQDAERRRRDLQGSWDNLYRRHLSGAITPEDISSMEYIAATFEDEKLIWFSDNYGLTSDYALRRLCIVDTSTARCQNQTNRINKAAADAAALAAYVADHNAGVDAARRAGLQSSLNTVEVRTYNSNGIYTGTTTMSQTQAEIIGARPQ